MSLGPPGAGTSDWGWWGGKLRSGWQKWTWSQRGFVHLFNRIVVEQGNAPARPTGDCRRHDAAVPRHFVAARLFGAFECKRIGLHPRSRKERIRFEFNSEPHSQPLFPMRHDQPPKLSSEVRSERAFCTSVASPLRSRSHYGMSVSEPAHTRWPHLSGRASPAPVSSRGEVVPRNRTVIRLGRALADHDLG
jgi:hypothetical protein